MDLAIAQGATTKAQSRPGPDADPHASRPRSGRSSGTAFKRQARHPNTVSALLMGPRISLQLPAPRLFVSPVGQGTGLSIGDSTEQRGRQC